MRLNESIVEEVALHLFRELATPEATGPAPPGTNRPPRGIPSARSFSSNDWATPFIEGVSPEWSLD
jgi:hypothetical protein